MNMQEHGQAIEIEPRDIEIYSIKLNSYNQKDEITFEVNCSKGTYIRTLCEDIAKRLGTVGYMKELQRTQVNIFDIKNSILLDDLENIKIEDKLISIEKIFSNNLKLNLSDRKLELFLNGVQLTYEIKNGLYRVYNNNKFIGLGIVNSKLLKRDIVI